MNVKEYLNNVFCLLKEPQKHNLRRLLDVMNVENMSEERNECTMLSINYKYL